MGGITVVNTVFGTVWVRQFVGSSVGKDRVGGTLCGGIVCVKRVGRIMRVRLYSVWGIAEAD